MEIILAIVGAAFAGFSGGVFVFRRFFPVKVSVTHATAPGPTLSPRVRHKHEYDHVRDDSKGWRCGVCDKPRKKE